MYAPRIPPLNARRACERASSCSAIISLKDDRFWVRRRSCTMQGRDRVRYPFRKKRKKATREEKWYFPHTLRELHNEIYVSLKIAMKQHRTVIHFQTTLYDAKYKSGLIILFAFWLRGFMSSLSLSRSIKFDLRQCRNKWFVHEMMLYIYLHVGVFLSQENKNYRY